MEVGRGADGSAVIPMHQPYGGWAKTLLEVQHYPEDRLYPGGPPKRPYDVTANTLPMLMGVDVKAVDAGGAVLGRVEGAGPGKGSGIARGGHRFVARREPPHGSRAGRCGAIPPAAISRWPRAADGRERKPPRIGLYQPWQPNMDEGWTRWLLENFGFAYTGLRNADIQHGGLRQKFDAIVFAEQAANSIENGFGRNAMPAEYTGGLGANGAAALKEFANAGGTLVFLNGASEYAISRLGVQARTVTPAREQSDAFYSPGSLLNCESIRRVRWLTAYRREIAIWSEHSPAWDTQLPVVARYPDSGVLASGWLVGEKVIAGHAAMIDAPMGRATSCCSACGRSTARKAT